jgi:uncharacterized SAM-binding protein YcdF (DUF218 family)
VRLTFLALGAAVATGALLWIAHAPMLRAVASVLSVDDPVLPADVAVVLAGSEQSRAKRAAELYLAGDVGRIALAIGPELLSDSLDICEEPVLLFARILERLGVERDSIDLVTARERGVWSTHDEAVALQPYLRERDRVVIVTSELHTRRARMTFRRVLGDWSGQLGVIGVEHSGFDRRLWWLSERGIVTVNNEWIKLLFYIAFRH